MIEPSAVSGQLCIGDACSVVQEEEDRVVPVVVLRGHSRRHWVVRVRYSSVRRWLRRLHLKQERGTLPSSYW